MLRGVKNENEIDTVERSAIGATEMVEPLQVTNQLWSTSFVK